MLLLIFSKTSPVLNVQSPNRGKPTIPHGNQRNQVVKYGQDKPAARTEHIHPTVGQVNDNRPATKNARLPTNATFSNPRWGMTPFEPEHVSTKDQRKKAVTKFTADAKARRFITYCRSADFIRRSSDNALSCYNVRAWRCNRSMSGTPVQCTPEHFASLM